MIRVLKKYFTYLAKFLSFRSTEFPPFIVTSAYQNTQTYSDYAGLENVSLSLLMNLKEKKLSCELCYEGLYSLPRFKLFLHIVFWFMFFSDAEKSLNLTE